MNAPLLSWSGLRLDHAGMPLFDGHGDFAMPTEQTAPAGQGAAASRLLVLGAPRALFLAVAGELDVARGQLFIRGVSAASARRGGHLAVVRFDAALPPAWKTLRYVTWGARLAGVRAGEAKEAAYRALAASLLDPQAKLGALDEAARVRVPLAAALASGAEVVAIDDVFAARTDGAAAALEEAILTALAAYRRAWILFAARAPLASRFAQEADRTVVVAGADVAAEGTAASIASLARAYVLRLETRAPAGELSREAAREAAREGADASAAETDAARAAFAKAAEASGISLTTRGDATVVVLPPELGTRALFPLAAAADLAIVELRPLAGPLS